MKRLLLLLGLALLAPGRAALAQTAPASWRLVKGMVRDARTALPVRNVWIIVKDDPNASGLTDSTGHFQLWVAHPEQAVLQFGKYNYAAQDRPLAPETKPEMRVWLAKPKPNWKSKKALARDSVRRAQQASNWTAGTK